MRGLNEAEDLTLSEELVREVSGLRGAGGGSAAPFAAAATPENASSPLASSLNHAHRHSLEYQDMAHRPASTLASSVPRPLSQALPSTSVRASLMSPPSSSPKDPIAIATAATKSSSNESNSQVTLGVNAIACALLIQPHHSFNFISFLVYC